MEMPKKLGFKRVSILLPAMDETYSLEKTVDTIWETCAPEDLAEFIIILCGRTSPECRATAEKLVEKYQGKTRIYIHDQIKPFVGGAVQEGFDLAVGSHVVLMSSDLETDPVLVQEFIRQAKSAPEKVITASRWLKGGGFKGYNKVKLVCNIIFEKTIAIFYGVKLTDLTYGYRCFPTGLVQSIRWEEQKHPFFLETALKPIRLGVEFVEVPTKWVARTEGVSQNSFFANFKYFKTAWHIRFMPQEILSWDPTGN